MRLQMLSACRFVFIPNALDQCEIYIVEHISCLTCTVLAEIIHPTSKNRIHPLSKLFERSSFVFSTYLSNTVSQMLACAFANCRCKAIEKVTVFALHNTPPKSVSKEVKRFMFIVFGI